MTKCTAFLRGINVGSIRIKMSDLQVAFEALSYANVKTYLQTGNIVFDSNETLEAIKENLEQKLTQTFHYEAFVLLVLHDSLAEIIKNYPFEQKETHHAYVIFVEKNSVLEELKTLVETIGDEKTRIAFGEMCVYWTVQKGETLHTAFAKTIAKAKYKSVTTTRNINTLEKMLS
jgi:uncharacterized protein (DUF1697 family)